MNQVITLAETKQEKTKLEHAIRDLALEFSNKTGIVIDSIDLVQFYSYDEKHIHYHVKVEASL